MALEHAPRATTPPAAAPAFVARPPVVLCGRWLLAARILFVAFVAVALWLDLTTVLRAIRDGDNPLAMTYESVYGSRTVLADMGIPLPAYLTILAWLNILIKVIDYGAALLLFRHRSREAIGLLVALFFVALSVAFFPPVLFAQLATEPVRATLGLLATACLPLTFVLLFYLFPDGRFTPRWTIIPAVCWALWLGWSFAIRRSFESTRPLGDAPLLGALFASVVVAQAYRYRRVSGPVERQQTKWFLGGVGGALFAFLAGNLLLGAAGALGGGGAGAHAAYAWIFFDLAGTLAGLCMPVGLTIAVLKYRLFAIDVAINRALVYGGLTAAVIGLYGGLTAAVIGLYVLTVGYLGQLFNTGGNLAISLVATGLVAVLFQPLRERLQRGANRLLYGERDEPYAVISRLGRLLEGTLAPEAILPTIVGTVAGALKLPYAAIALGSGAERTVAAATGTPVPSPIRLPLAYQGEPVGELLLAPRAPGEQFSRADRRLLADLARQAGVAARAVRLAAEASQLTVDLQASRARLVTAREEERRRLRRDLHDGLGPRLAALTLRLETARDALADDPRADMLLGDLADRTEEAVADIRRLIYALRPPALDDLGLAGALRQAAGSYDPGPLRIAVAVPETLPPLPAAVEVAAYRIATEALTNVVRHANASHCTIRLALDEPREALLVEIADDGRGLARGRKVGVGTGSMRERAEELGGGCTIEPRPGGGTRVRATLPCRPTSDMVQEES